MVVIYIHSVVVATHLLVKAAQTIILIVQGLEDLHTVHIKVVVPDVVEGPEATQEAVLVSHNVMTPNNHSNQ